MGSARKSVLHLQRRSRRAFLSSLLFVVFGAVPLYAQDVVESTAAAGLVGVTKIPLGSEVKIYSIGLQDPFPLSRVNDLGNLTLNRGIEITISDLSTPTGLAASDFTALRLYRSSDAVLDGGDALMLTQPAVNIGAVTSFDVTGLPSGPGTDRRISAPPAQTFYLITAVISPSAVRGHAFRVGAAANHVGLVESGLPPPVAGDYTMGSAIIASDANHVVIGAEAAQLLSGGTATIPFGGEPAILLLLLGTGLCAIRRYV